MISIIIAWIETSFDVMFEAEKAEALANLLMQEDEDNSWED